MPARSRRCGTARYRQAAPRAGAPPPPPGEIKAAAPAPAPGGMARGALRLLCCAAALLAVAGTGHRRGIRGVPGALGSAAPGGWILPGATGGWVMASPCPVPGTGRGVQVLRGTGEVWGGDHALPGTRYWWPSGTLGGSRVPPGVTGGLHLLPGSARRDRSTLPLPDGGTSAAKPAGPGTGTLAPPWHSRGKGLLVGPPFPAWAPRTLPAPRGASAHPSWHTGCLVLAPTPSWQRVAAGWGQPIPVSLAAGGTPGHTVPLGAGSATGHFCPVSSWGQPGLAPPLVQTGFVQIKGTASPARQTCSIPRGLWTVPSTPGPEVAGGCHKGWVGTCPPCCGTARCCHAALLVASSAVPML